MAIGSTFITCGSMNVELGNNRTDTATLSGLSIAAGITGAPYSMGEWAGYISGPTAEFAYPYPTQVQDNSIYRENIESPSTITVNFNWEVISSNGGGIQFYTTTTYGSFGGPKAGASTTTSGSFSHTSIAESDTLYTRLSPTAGGSPWGVTGRLTIASITVTSGTDQYTIITDSSTHINSASG